MFTLIQSHIRVHRHKVNVIRVGGNGASIPSGMKRIAGVLTRNGVAERIPYRLYRRSDGALIRAGLSDLDGSYVITDVPNVLCQLIALDPQDEFNAGILDRLQPEA